MIRSKSKFWSLLLVMVLVLAACGGGSDDAAEEAEESGGEESATQTTAAPSSDGSSGLTGEILIDGSSTVFPITQAVAEEFTALNPDVQISVGVSGTGGGFKKFCPGETDISDASRPIKAKERDLCAENGTTYTELQVGVDALSVVVPTSNDFATCLTTEELGAIWGADSTVSSWNQVRSSFPDIAIDLYGPGTDSGHRGIDGMALDSDGNIVATCGWEVSGPGPMICIFDKKGRIILSERTPCMRPSNIAFGGKNLEDIYITSLEGHLYRVRNSGLKGNKLP